MVFEQLRRSFPPSTAKRGKKPGGEAALRQRVKALAAVWIVYRTWAVPRSRESSFPTGAVGVCEAETIFPKSNGYKGFRQESSFPPW
jgi:hypothetical protein